MTPQPLPDLPLPPELAMDDEPLTEAQLSVLDRDDQPIPHEHPVGSWQVADDGQAEWAFRKLTEAQAEHEQLRLQAEDWAARIDHWFAQRARPLARRIGYFTGQLEGYAMRLRAEAGVKTRPLPSGVVKTTGSDKPTVELADEAAVVEWAEANLAGAELDAVVKVERSVRISELRKLVAIKDGDVYQVGTGVRVEGVALAPGKVNPKVVPGG